MEKRRPHYPLTLIKERILQGDYRVTRTALACAIRDFGYTESSQVAAWILRLDPSDFYKSMTSIHDARLWQDVYRPLISERPAYVKVQIADEQTIIISLKLSEEVSNA